MLISAYAPNHIVADVYKEYRKVRFDLGAAEASPVVINCYPLSAPSSLKESESTNENS